MMSRPIAVRSAVALVLACAVAVAQFASTSDARQTVRLDSLYVARAAVAESVFFVRWKHAWMARMDSSLERLGDSAAFRIESPLYARRAMDRNLRDSVFGPPPNAPERGAVTPVFPAGVTFAPEVLSAFAAVHCHWDGQFGLRTFVKSLRAGQAMCPAWVFGYGTTGPRVTAPYVRAALHGSVEAARRKAITLLDTAAVHAPASAWVVGQRVRLAFDGRDTARALHIATNECATNVWWCAALTGYALSESGDVAGADSAFARATASTVGTARCQWTDIRGILQPPDRNDYMRLSCAGRDSLSRVFMWLADPLWSDGVNERRVENFARQVLVYLRSAVAHDEYYVWPAAYGGDATAETIIRYGWPSVIQWFGLRADDSHDRWLDARGGTHRPPYATAEYTRGRYHLSAEWSAVESPLTAAASDWTLSSDDPAWWPVEHMRLPYALVSLDTMQVAMFRRDTSALLAFSTWPPRAPGSTDSLDVMTMRGTAPNATHSMVSSRVITGQRHVISAPMQAGPALLSIEFANRARTAFSRARFGVSAPRALAAMRASDRAASDIALVEAPASPGDTLPNTLDAALRLLLPSTVVSARAGRVGLYWETYGFHQSDSVEVALRVQRITQQSVARRIGIALGSANDLNAPISITWNEPDPTRRAAALGGRVPTLGRSVVLALGALTAGDYWIDITVRSRSGETVSTRRTLTVR